MLIWAGAIERRALGQERAAAGPHLQQFRVLTPDLAYPEDFLGCSGTTP